MSAIDRFAVETVCPSCGRANTLLLPETSCGNEFIWHARCGTCGGWRWFHSREDRGFVAAIVETAKRRGEPGGLSPEGTREAHQRFEATVAPCACGGRLRVVADLKEESCLHCKAPLNRIFMKSGEARQVSVLPLRGMNEPL